MLITILTAVFYILVLIFLCAMHHLLFNKIRKRIEELEEERYRLLEKIEELEGK